MERAKGVEPSTFSLATRRSTTELYPQLINLVLYFFHNNALRRVCRENIKPHLQEHFKILVRPLHPKLSPLCDSN